MLATIVFVSQSCKKEEVLLQKENNKTENASFIADKLVVANPEHDKILSEKISMFKKYIKGESTTKDIIYYGEAEANELIETVANMDFVELSESFPEYVRDTFMYIIPINTDEEISSEALADVYDEIETNFESIVNTLNCGEEVQLQGLSIGFSPINGDNLHLRVNFILDVGFEPTENPFSITNNDSWYWGQELGKINGTLIGYDASSALTYQANNTLENIYSLSNYTFSGQTYISIDYDDVLYNNQWQSRIWNENNHQHYHWNNSTSSSEPYLDPTEMNYFLNQALIVAQLYKPSGYAIQLVNVTYVGQVNPQVSGYRAHRINVIYGIPHQL